MNIRVAEDASWTIRKSAWGLEERVLWRSRDAAHGAAEDAIFRAHRTMRPLQRLVQTKLTWPLADALRDRSDATKATIAASAVVVAIAAGGAGAVTAGHGSAQDPALPPPPPVTNLVPESSPLALQGVAPHFQPGHADVPNTPVAAPSEPPARVAWHFAQAFVGYEVGQNDDETAAAFAATATPALAKSLAANPPRLPEGAKVPKAQVLNVVIGDSAENQMVASVSLIRLRAMSEVRLTLIKAHDDWRVAQVLG